MSGSDHTATDQDVLKAAGIRPTRQRLALIRVIRQGGRRHLTPESFHNELAAAGIRLSLATVYNSLSHFTEMGLLRRVGFGDRSFYCTNPAEHHHFYDEATGRLEDIPGPQPRVIDLPEAPEGTAIAGIEVVVRLRRK